LGQLSRHLNRVQKLFGFTLHVNVGFQILRLVFLQIRQSQNLVTIGAVLRLHDEASFEHVSQVSRVVAWDGVVFACDDLRVEALHGCGAEGRQERDHFVEDAAQRPDVRLVVVGLIFPHFWRAVVGRARLGAQQALLGHFAHIEVAELDDASLGQEEIGALDVPVTNFE